MSDDGIGLTRNRPYRLRQLREGAADATRRACADCGHMVGYVSWWCDNEAAVKAHGTNMPCCGSGCAFWEAPPMVGKLVGKNQPPTPETAWNRVRRWLLG